MREWREVGAKWGSGGPCGMVLSMCKLQKMWEHGCENGGAVRPCPAADLPSELSVFLLQKAKVQSLVGQLRSHRPMKWSKQANKEKENRREPIK